MTYDSAIVRAVALAGDEYAVVGVRDVGSAASPVLIYDADGNCSGTQWQACTLDDAKSWAADGMVGVICVCGYYDNDAEAWAAKIRR